MALWGYTRFPFLIDDLRFLSLSPGGWTLQEKPNIAGICCSKGWGCLGTCKACMIQWGKPSKLFRLKLSVSRKSLLRMLSWLSLSHMVFSVTEFCLIIANLMWTLVYNIILDLTIAEQIFKHFVWYSQSYVVLVISSSVTVYNIVLHLTIAERSLMVIVMMNL